MFWVTFSEEPALGQGSLELDLKSIVQWYHKITSPEQNHLARLAQDLFQPVVYPVCDRLALV